ncbi:MAG: FtsX-like permease family protein, partial [Cyclobacteriaceae bacterium]|nr:FtsX-like permease family protein [Cyclobacteriaceae bacterium]
FKHSGETRLIRVVALKGGFPFYGEVQTRPEGVFPAIKEGPFAIMDENLASRHSISNNDTLKIGKMDFIMAGEVLKIPGGSAMSSTFTPSIYISMDYLDSTGLLQYGSRVNYKNYFKAASIEEVEQVTSILEPELKKFGHRYETVDRRKERLGEGFSNLYKFFNLLAFVALVLGCIGIASSVHIYAREKRQSVAVLRCLGSSGWQAFNIYFIQTVVTGIVGSLIGVLVGIMIQYGLPAMLNQFLPMDIRLRLAWSAIGEGLLLGLVISVLFSILPLVSVRFVPPLSVLRTNFKPLKKWSKTGVTVVVLAALFPLLFATYQAEDLLTGVYFFVGLGLAFLLLLGVARLIMFLVGKYFPRKAGFIWRHGLSNLFRPNNQTAVMVIVIGLGAFLVATLHIVQTSLLNQVEFVGEENQSNTILFDIQKHQVEDVKKLTEENGLPIKQFVPIVTCRIASINGKTVRDIQNDTTDAISNWAITREYRVTYRDSLHHAEQLLEGKIHRKVTSGSTDSVFVTISQGMQENLEVNIGDTVVFDVQGFPITTYIGGIREVEWPKDPPNFIFVFPTGVLEEAPQIYVLTTRVDEKNVADKYSRELVALFPNISLIDLRLILSTINDFFDKVAFVIRFMALFSIITGLIVLAGAVRNSKYARLKENVLLRTIGAAKKQILGITLVEYGYLGVFAGFAGVLLSLISGFVLSFFFFDIIFFPDLLGLLIIWIGVVILTVLVGWLNTRNIFDRSPLEVLRKEAL